MELCTPALKVPPTGLPGKPLQALFKTDSKTREIRKPLAVQGSKVVGEAGWTECWTDLVSALPLAESVALP